MWKWVKENYEKIILWIILGIWVGLGWQFYTSWMSKVNPSRLDRLLRPSRKWDPSIVNKDLKEKNLDILLAEKPLPDYKFLLSRNPFFPLPPFSPPKEEVSKKRKEDRKPKITMDLTCQGVMKMNNKLVAVLKNNKTGASYFVEEGMEVEGWKVDSISPSGVILIRPGSPRYELKVGG